MVNERLYRPWRMAYVTSAGASDDGCFLCAAAAGEDEAARRVVARRDRTLAILNAYPYNSGHLMVAPLRHVGDLTDLDDAEQAEVMALVVECVGALRTAYKPDGFNVGVNLGHAGGAGLPGHVHVHLVPRWTGDTNFMPVFGDTKVLPEILDETYGRLAPLLSPGDSSED